MKKQNYLITPLLLCTFALPSLAHCKQLTQPVATQKITPAPHTPQTMYEKIEEEEEEPIKQRIQPATTTPSNWSMIYNLLPQIFIQSFSTGSDAGIGAFTKNLTKQFMQKRTFTHMKNEAFSDINNSLKESNEFATEEEKLNMVKNYFRAKNKINFDEWQQQTSTSFIVSSAASTALIYTFSAMMGQLLKFGIVLSLQALAPQAH